MRTVYQYREDRVQSHRIMFRCEPARAVAGSPRLGTRRRAAELSFGCMKITDVRATTVTVPLEAPLRHANGCHWGRFVRTIVEVETDNGLIGLGEMGGGGESAVAAIAAHEGVSAGTRPGASRRDAVSAGESNCVALQQPHTDRRGHRVRVPRSARAVVGRARLRHSRRPRPRPCDVCVVPVFSVCRTRQGLAPSARKISSSLRPAR